MYEIWLMLNIVWELALGVWPLLLALAVVWLLFLVAALRGRGTSWRGGLPIAAGVAAVAGVIAFLAVPALTRASLGDLAYWVDWLALAGIALAAAAAAGLFVWPLAAFRGRPQTS